MNNDKQILHQIATSGAGWPMERRCEAVQEAYKLGIKRGQTTKPPIDLEVEFPYTVRVDQMEVGISYMLKDISDECVSVFVQIMKILGSDNLHYIDHPEIKIQGGCIKLAPHVLVYSRTPVDDGSVRLGDIKEDVFVTFNKEDMNPANVHHVHPNGYASNISQDTRVWLVDVKCQLTKPE
jgi:hypothetical protein